MRITIIGGSKGTGARLAEVARDAGHEVTVLSRSGEAPTGVTSIRGSATDPESARQAVADADAVVVTVGGAKGVRHHRAAVTRTVVDAMATEGVRRLVVQSSLGAGDSGSQMPLPLRVVMKALLAKPLADHDAQEAVAMSSGLDWTIVRPTGLTDKPATGTWQALEVGDEGTLRGSVPREDVAAFMLDVLGEASTVGKAYGVSS